MGVNEENFIRELNNKNSKALEYVFNNYCDYIYNVVFGIFGRNNILLITIETKKPTEVSEIIDGVYPIELSQGKMGKLIIKEIKTEGNKTIVKYTAEGKVPYFQAQDVLIKDDQGKNIEIKDYNIRKDEQKPNEFTKVFGALDPNKKYTIYTNDFSNVEFREDLKFKIELNK